MFLVCEGLANIENDFFTQLVMNEIILQTFRFQPGKVLTISAICTSLPASTHTVYTIKLYSKLLNLVAICTRPHYNVWNIWAWNICVKTFNRKREAAFNIDNEQRQVYIYGNIPRNYMYMKFGLKICFALVSLENVNSVFSVHSVTVNEVLKQFVFLVHGCV